MKTRSLALLHQSLHTLTSSQLTRQVDLLAEQEHLQVAVLIAHLAEVSVRGLHLELGYRTLFDYCVQRLGLSEGCTALRIQVGRVCRRHPMILDALAGQKVSLTVAGKLAPYLTADNCERLVADCSGMTKRAVEEYLVHLAPKPAVSPGVRLCPVPAAAAAPANPVFSAEDPPPATAPKPEPSRPAPPKTSSVQACQPDIYNVRFPAHKRFIEKMDRAAEVSGMGDARRNIAEILERALDTHLEKYDPEKRQERREKRAARRAATTAEVTIEAADAAEDCHSGVEGSGTIPAELRDRLFIRAGHCCEFRSRDGRRCRERSYLEIDHIEPRAFCGKSKERGMRVLCRAHNRLHADRCFGPEFMEFKIESARSISSGYPPRASFPKETRPSPDEVENPTMAGH